MERLGESSVVKHLPSTLKLLNLIRGTSMSQSINHNNKSRHTNYTISFWSFLKLYFYLYKNKPTKKSAWSFQVPLVSQLIIHSACVDSRRKKIETYLFPWFDKAHESQ